LNEAKLSSLIDRSNNELTSYYHGLKSRIRELKQLAGLSQDTSSFNIRVGQYEDSGPTTLAIRTRSLHGVMLYLSQNVEVPLDHQAGGFVGVAMDNDGNQFDWHDVCNHFTVRYSDKYPKNSYVTYKYRGKYFYIADDDRESKMTFMLVMELRNFLM
jgi:hypothetical protein